MGLGRFSVSGSIPRFRPDGAGDGADFIDLFAHGIEGGSRMEQEPGREGEAMTTTATTRTAAPARAVTVYAFDVDETLEVSAGPIRLQALADLVTQGHIVGICGNWSVLTHHLPDWHRIISFLSIGDKAEFLQTIARDVPAAGYVMVGNVVGVSGASDDQGAARRAGWRFIREAAFAAGER